MTEPSTTEAPARHTGRWIAVGVGALVLLLGYGAAVAAVSSQDVPAGTTVAGVDIGGLTADDAVARLQEELGDAAAAPIPVTAGEASTEIDPSEAGLAVDWAATVDQATGLVLDPVDLFTRLRGDVAVDPVTTTDEKALATSLESLAQVAAVDPVEPTITLTKKAVVTTTPGTPGTRLDAEAAAGVVSDAYFRLPYESVALPMTPVDPTVSDEEADRVRKDLAEPAVAAPVTVRVVTGAEPSTAPSASPEAAAPAAGPSASAPATSGSAETLAQATLTPAQVAAALSFGPADGTLAPTLDGKALHEDLADQLAAVERPGTDARIEIRGAKPVVVKSKSGRAVGSDELSAAVLAVLPATSADARVAQVTLTKSKADFTTAEAKALNITEKLSSFRQWFPPAAYRWQNVGQAAAYLNGTIIEPGGTFSMNGTIKERTRANGYTEGYIISGGRFREELGGGVSIITTATWTAGFYAGLERVEQHPHGLYISRYKAGLEATVAYGLLDLRLRNDTGNGVLITAKRYSDGVVIEMWGTKKFDKVTATFTDRYNFTGYQTIHDDSEGCVPSDGVQGFSIAVTRRRYVDGKAVSTETWPTTYKPTPVVVCGAGATPIG